jgi:hypothetical protein
MGKLRVLLSLAIAGCLVVFAGESAAQDASVVTREFPNPKPPLGDAVGSINTEVTCPANRVFAPGADSVGRSVRVTLSKPGVGYRDVTSLLLLGAAMTAFQVCPMAHTEGAAQVPDRTVDSLDVLASPSDGAPVVQVLHAEHFANDSGQWAQVTDVLARNAQAQASAETTAPQAPAIPPPAADASASAAPNPQQPDAVASGAQSGRSQDQSAVDPAEREAENRVFIGKLQLWGAVALGAVALFGLFNMRVAIMRWYYFHFDRHPAESLVRTAIRLSNGSGTNPALLAEALGEIPPRGAVLRQVRLEQAERLYGELRNACVARQQAYAERARRNQIELHESEVFLGMQEALGLAAVALERAKAAYAMATSLKSRRISA